MFRVKHKCDMVIWLAILLNSLGLIVTQFHWSVKGETL